MFKDILYPTLHSVENQTFDGRIMYLAGSLCNNYLEQEYVRILV